MKDSSGVDFRGLAIALGGDLLNESSVEVDSSSIKGSEKQVAWAGGQSGWSWVKFVPV